MWPATTFSVAPRYTLENLQIWNFLQLLIVNISADCWGYKSRLASTRIRRFGPPLKAAFSKWPPSKNNCPPKAYVSTLLEKFSNQALWELHESEKKIIGKRNALSKTFFNVIRESRAIKYVPANYNTALIWYSAPD